MLKNNFSWFTLGRMIVSKKNSDLQLAYQNLDTVEIVDYKKKMILKFNYIV